MELLCFIKKSFLVLAPSLKDPEIVSKKFFLTIHEGTCEAWKTIVSYILRNGTFWPQI